LWQALHLSTEQTNYLDSSSIHGLCCYHYFFVCWPRLSSIFVDVDNSADNDEKEVGDEEEEEEKALTSNNADDDSSSSNKNVTME
jgi:hypothetical protein